MNKYINNLRRMDWLIRTRSTGCPEDFAGILCLSVRSLYNYLSIMRSLGAPIEYSRCSESYFYTEEVHFIFKFEAP